MKRTNRGFAIAEFKDTYGVRCTLQKSSLATADCIWLGVHDAEHKNFTPGGNPAWTPFPLPESVQCSSRMHLTRAQVKRLLPALQHFVKTGELPMPKRKRRTAK